ncbi:MAG: transposase [Deltaproteobacteria bacterium]|nr:transposase [Deltaproteobacteria bacterium]
MKRKRFTEEQIIGVLNEAEQTGNIREICRLNNISEQTFYRWRTKFGGMDVSEAKRLKDLGALPIACSIYFLSRGRILNAGSKSS